MVSEQAFKNGDDVAQPLRAKRIIGSKTDGWPQAELLYDQKQGPDFPPKDNTISAKIC
jgi:hypothetical protein